MIYSKLKSGNVDAWLWTPVEEVESAALDQIRLTAELPWVFHHVAIMSDVHYGNGATIGSVVAMKGAVAPAAVGVDIGCGVSTIKTSLKATDLPDNLKSFRHMIESIIPVGFNSNKETDKVGMKNDLWTRFPNLIESVHNRESKARLQCGSLGGGNHYISLLIDTNQYVWLMLHSGSRNIGKEIAEVHIKTAKKLEHNSQLPNKDLSVFLSDTPEMSSYLHDLNWAQEYAFLNRTVMMRRYKAAVIHFFRDIKDLQFDEEIKCIHNYVSEETHFGEDVLITRKGAISAKESELGIIPGAMGIKSYVVKGLGNPDSFTSASHGAGRRMSRGAAKKSFTLEDLAIQTAGAECRKDIGVLDEIPGAYKDITKVINQQSDLVEVVAELQEVMTIKG